MQRIVVANAKGGCGKSTVATNLAAYLAGWEQRVALADMDAQKSSLEWLRARPVERPAVHGIAAAGGQLSVDPRTDVLVVDTPGGHRDPAAREQLATADRVIIPVLPSPVDIRAAAHFIHELLLVDRVSRNRTRVAVVANRARMRTVAYRDLERFLNALQIPFLTTLRESRNYLAAAEQGLGIFELAPSAVARDLEQWAPITRFVHDEAV